MIMLKKTLMITIRIMFIIEKREIRRIVYRLSGDPLVPSDDLLWGRILMARPSSHVWACLPSNKILSLLKENVQSLYKSFFPRTKGIPVGT